MVVAVFSSFGMMAQSPAPERVAWTARSWCCPSTIAADQPNLDWISEAIPEVLNRRLASAGFMPISRDDRLYALDHLGLPSTFQPSRASAIRLAQTLDADYIIVGSFSTTGARFQAKAQVLKVESLHMSAPIQEEADMPHLLDVLNSLAWGLAKQLDPQFAVARNTFVAAGAGLRVDAFENYTRGLVEPDPDEQIRHLKEAVRLDPTFSPALLALGKAYFANQQFELAATTLGRLPRNDPNAREADFDRGLAYFYLGSYVKAEDAFAFVSKQLPLPEVVNNQGVTASRRGLDATSFFQQAVAADPNDPDYQFNLAVALQPQERRSRSPAGDRANAETSSLRYRGRSLPGYPPRRAAASFCPGRRTKQSGKCSLRSNRTGRDPASGADQTELQRGRPSARLPLKWSRWTRLAWPRLPPQKHAAALTEAGMRFFNQGLILEAEREFQAALVADGGNADAHAGLALVRERGGDLQEAHAQADESVKMKPNVTAYLVLARLDLQANQKPAAAADVSERAQAGTAEFGRTRTAATDRKQGAAGSMNRFLLACSALILSCCGTLACVAQQTQQNPEVVVDPPR